MYSCFRLPQRALLKRLALLLKRVKTATAFPFAELEGEGFVQRVCPGTFSPCQQDGNREGSFTAVLRSQSTGTSVDDSFRASKR